MSLSFVTPERGSSDKLIKLRFLHALSNYQLLIKCIRRMRVMIRAICLSESGDSCFTLIFGLGKKYRPQNLCVYTDGRKLN